MHNFDKLKNFQKALADRGIEAALVTSVTNHFYLTDFFASAAMLITPSNAWYLTDFRTIEAAGKHFENSGISLTMTEGSFLPYAARIISENHIESVSIENRTLTYDAYTRWERNLPCKVKGLDGLIEQLRQIKFPEEIDCTIKAQRIVEKSLDSLLPLIRPGISEQELVAELIYRFYKNGAEGLAFPVIILSGENSSLPHGFPGQRIIQNGDFVTLDIGVKIGGYCSDMTRTFAVGYATDEMTKVYDTVLKAQLTGIAAIAPGRCGHDVDAEARAIIDSSEFAGTFGHGLGHSVGLVCHDGMTASKGSRDIFKAGNIITMEPGIYLPGRFGCRIEDMVLLTDQGTKDLTDFPKELTILK